MRGLLIVDVVLTLACATMALVLGVVTLLYWIYADSTPRLAADVPGLLVMTLAFGGGAVVAGLTARALHTAHRMRWAWHAVLAVTLAGVSAYVWDFAQ